MKTFGLWMLIFLASIVATGISLTFLTDGETIIIALILSYILYTLIKEETNNPN